MIKKKTARIHGCREHEGAWVERLVVDTNALIKRVRLDEVAQQLYTVPSVLVRPDKRPRGSWSLRSAALTARILPVRFGRPRSRTIARQIWSSI